MDLVTISNALKSVFGTSLTTATNIPVCAADGTPGGNISVANLASVLGGVSPKLLTANDDLNTIFNNGWKMYYTMNADNPSNTPSVQQCYNNIIWCYKQGERTRYTQFLYSINNGKLFVRKYNDNWFPWEAVSTDVPSFYKDYASLSALATALKPYL